MAETMKIRNLFKRKRILNKDEELKLRKYCLEKAMEKYSSHTEINNAALSFYLFIVEGLYRMKDK